MEPPNEPNPPLSFFSSLPEDIVLSILARISTLYYPKLSLVSKSFHTLILSKQLEWVRILLGTRENCVWVCIQSPTHPCDERWFSLWIKPDYHDPTVTYPTMEDKTTGNLLVPMPSSYTPYLPRCLEMIGSDIYEIGGQDMPSTDVSVYNVRTGKDCKVPSMMVPRMSARTCPLDGKVYVVGGCESDEPTYWAEVFDPKTQTWEPLPDPGTELRFSSIIKVEAKQEKVYVKTIKKNFVYLPNESRWEVDMEHLGEVVCHKNKIVYCYQDNKCWWYDPKSCEDWMLIRGLEGLDRHFRIGDGVEIGTYGEKLVVFWVGPAAWHPDFCNPEIWCAIISLEKSLDGELWGKIDWVDVVLTVPYTHTLLSCVEAVQ